MTNPAVSAGLLPNASVVLDGGILDGYAKALLTEELLTTAPPELTQLISPLEGHANHLRRGIVGLKDKTMEPMIRPGSIYFLMTRESYLTGFCELDRTGDWLTLVPHALSYQLNRRWKYRQEIEVVGEVVSFVSRRTAPIEPAAKQ